MTANLTHETASIIFAPTIAELALGTDASGGRGHDGVVLSRLGPAVDVVPDDHPVEDFVGALVNDRTDDIVPDDELASVLRDAWRRAQLRVGSGRNTPVGGDRQVDIADVHHALRMRAARQPRVTALVVDTGGGTLAFLPLTMQPTPRLSWALRLAAHEARRAGADTVGIAHLVRGLLAEAERTAMASLIRLDGSVRGRSTGHI
ncbi:MAG: hypothetical protein EB033_11990 [Proteobacteria bacterium]|nr:hypothetical protein [Pseudomonadota bacterium]NDG98627.1 hypothetical protein [Pseudomonadota bacterium]